MDAEQLQQLATNAQLNHWPPHLGVTTDAEKVEYLAQWLREAAIDLGDRSDECEHCSICDVHGSKENNEIVVDAADVIGIHKKLADTLHNLRNATIDQVNSHLNDLESDIDELEALALP